MNDIAMTDKTEVHQLDTIGQADTSKDLLDTASPRKPGSVVSEQDETVSPTLRT